MGLLDNIKSGVDCKAYKWHIYQIERYHRESDAPCAIFFHEEDAAVLFNYLSDRFCSIRFVMTNVETGDSYVG